MEGKMVTSRTRFNVRITNYWRNNGEADFVGEPSRLTTRQALERYAEYHPSGATHLTAFECIGPDGKRYNVDDLRRLIEWGNIPQK